MAAFGVEGGACLTEVLPGDEDGGGEGTDRVSCKTGVCDAALPSAGCWQGSVPPRVHLLP